MQHLLPNNCRSDFHDPESLSNILILLFEFHRAAHEFRLKLAGGFANVAESRARGQSIPASRAWVLHPIHARPIVERSSTVRAAKRRRPGSPSLSQCGRCRALRARGRPLTNVSGDGLSAPAWPTCIDWERFT
jgi:hypothetical protein